MIEKLDYNPLQYSCLENPMDRGAWWATVHGVAKSQTQFSDRLHTRYFLNWNLRAFYGNVRLTLKSTSLKFKCLFHLVNQKFIFSNINAITLCGEMSRIVEF